MYEVLDLCLACKSCKAECPSNVDLARLKCEFLQMYHDAHGSSLRDKLAANPARLAAAVAGWKAPAVNWLQGTFLFRKGLELLAGFDCRRQLLAYARLPFHQWFAARPQTERRFNGRVVLFDDTYMRYYETNVGISAVALLEACGYEVLLANAGCCQRPRISHGFLREARRDGEETLRRLDRHIQQGLQVVVCEPSCCSALTDDLPDLIEDEELGGRIKKNVMPIDEFLAREIESGKLDVTVLSRLSSAREESVWRHFSWRGGSAAELFFCGASFALGVASAGRSPRAYWMPSR
jgi:Fe-S oxidoreductase